MEMIIIEQTTDGWTIDYQAHPGDRPSYRHTSYAHTPAELRAAIEGMVRAIIENHAAHVHEPEQQGVQEPGQEGPQLFGPQP